MSFEEGPMPNDIKDIVPKTDLFIWLRREISRRNQMCLTKNFKLSSMMCFEKTMKADEYPPGFHFVVIDPIKGTILFFKEVGMHVEIGGLSTYKHLENISQLVDPHNEIIQRLTDSLRKEYISLIENDVIDQFFKDCHTERYREHFLAKSTEYVCEIGQNFFTKASKSVHEITRIDEDGIWGVFINSDVRILNIN